MKYRNQFIIQFDDIKDTHINTQKRFERFVETVLDYGTLGEYYPKTESLKNMGGDIQDILKRRRLARQKGDYVESDRLRNLICKKGYRVIDLIDDEILEKI